LVGGIRTFWGFHLPVRGRMPSLELIWNDLVESSRLLAGS
jgi:hypothetical protein